MSLPQGVVSFLPFLRQGLATKVATTAGPRGTITIDLQLEGNNIGGSGTSTTSVSHKVQLYGPGDVIGIDARAIIRTEPRNWTTNFEPNYVPHIEFYDEDFPWRFSPQSADGARLTPWLTLLALEESEFNDVVAVPGQPLPVIQVTNANAFPAAGDLWAWAHVHVNRDISSADNEFSSGNKSAILDKFEHVLAENADLAYSRIICPRKLTPNSAYHAFLIPTFEIGRLAGLHENVSPDADGTAIAWIGTDKRFPVFHRWYFRTSAAGDFEELVRLIHPKIPNPMVGVRPMDVHFESGNPPETFDVTVQLGGALRIPRKTNDPPETDPDHWDEPFPNDLERSLAKFLNLADDYAFPASSGPLITPPLYGCWHALSRRLLTDRAQNALPNIDNWFHELNLDPRYRVPAGYGTHVIQNTQEDLMKAAWDQLGEVLEANRRIRQAQLAREVSFMWYTRHVKPLQEARVDRAFMITAPVHRNVVSDGRTIHQQETDSHLSTAAVSTAFRRLTRPRGRMMKSLAFGSGAEPDNLLSRMGSGDVQAAPPKATPSGFTSIDRLAELDDSFKKLSFDSQIHRLCRRLPQVDFHISEPSERGHDAEQGQDSPEGKAFRDALCNTGDTIQVSYGSGEEPPREPIDIGAATDVVIAAINPLFTIPNRIGRTIKIPSRITDDMHERFQEAMAYPRFDTAMYQPLSEISSDLLLPNINLIEQNSITLLETNNRFIESYMVGLNHEFARELLWREYPTDQRGSYFRQFWSPDTHFDNGAGTPDERREKLYDIIPLHRWPRASQLRTHNPRSISGADEEQLVLIVRGELLKRYPNTVIMAQRAKWHQETPGGPIDKTKPRELVDYVEGVPDPRQTIRTPLYEAKIAPDIYFFGFDLNVEQARGDDMPAPDDAGWFFVLKERPGEPRFGLDDHGPASFVTANDISWESVAPSGIKDGEFLPAGALNVLTFANPSGDAPDEVKAQHADDSKIEHASIDSARWAYLLFQSPVMVAIHAMDMLLK